MARRRSELKLARNWVDSSLQRLWKTRSAARLGGDASAAGGRPDSARRPKLLGKRRSLREKMSELSSDDGAAAPMRQSDRPADLVEWAEARESKSPSADAKWRFAWRKCPSRGNVELGVGDLRLLINEGPFSPYKHSLKGAQLLSIAGFASGRKQKRSVAASECAICRRVLATVREKMPTQT
jgi:hypothetical protein